MFVAEQYRKTLDRGAGAANSAREDATSRAARLVDGFLAARFALKDVAGTPGHRIARHAALVSHGMSDDDYAVVRTQWRLFEAGKPVEDAALAGAFEARRVPLSAAGLGEAEAADDAIK
jgi:hypothetical protein